MLLLGGPELRCAATPTHTENAPCCWAGSTRQHLPWGADYQLVIEGVLGSGVESEEEVLG